MSVLSRPMTASFGLTTSTLPKGMHSPCQDLLSFLEGCELCHQCLQLIHQHPLRPAPPLPEGCGPVHACLTEELGMDEHKGEPVEWEAHAVHHKTWATMFVVAHLCHPTSSYSSPLTSQTLLPGWNDTWQHPSHSDNNNDTSTSTLTSMTLISIRTTTKTKTMTLTMTQIFTGWGMWNGEGGATQGVEGQ